MNAIFFTTFKTPLCEVILVGNQIGLTNLHMVTNEGKRQFRLDSSWERDDDLMAAAQKQIQEYFDGKRTKFNIPLFPQGTGFQQRIWRALLEIPYGEVRTYGEIARSIGNPKASRAVGAANGNNPIPILIPCHRVVGSNGELTGFAHGLDAKQTLLELEKHTIKMES